MPHSIKFLTSDQASELRLKRVGHTTKKAELVVHVEIHPRMDVDERFYEFDAVDGSTPIRSEAATIGR